MTTTTLPDRYALGRLIYLALYGHQGAVWEANETQSVWTDAADRLRASLATTPPATASGSGGGYEPWQWANPGIPLPACPMCGAAAGDPCPDGLHPNVVHAERLRAPTAGDPRNAREVTHETISPDQPVYTRALSECPALADINGRLA